MPSQSSLRTGTWNLAKKMSLNEITAQPSGPKWLTVEYFEKVLRRYKQDKSLKVVDFRIKPATAKGENYASAMTRVQVNYRTKTDTEVHRESLIMKASIEDAETASRLMVEYDAYSTEMNMYKDILPKITAILSEIGDHEKLFADTVHVDNERSVIIFEDLSVQNYAVGDRLAGMDMAHAELALKKMAKMHAAAAVLNERSPGILRTFDRGIFNRYTRGFAPYFENTLLVCAEFARNSKELGNYYADKLLALKPHLVEYARRVFDPCEQYFNTLNHGDFWINNIMLRYSPPQEGAGKSLRDILLIDFQFCAWASPAVDLHYFFNTSLVEDLRLYHQEKLVHYYYQHLSQTLEQLQYRGKIPTLHELWVQLEAGRFYALSSALIVQPVMINDKTDDADFDALLVDDERGRNFRKLVYSNPVVQKRVKKLLPIFDRRGLLDIYN